MALQDKSYFYITVKPKSSQNIVCYNTDGDIEVKVSAPPINSKANKAVIELLSLTLKIPKSRLSIDKGQGSKLKKIIIDGLNDVELQNLLTKTIKSTTK